MRNKKGLFIDRKDILEIIKNHLHDEISRHKDISDEFDTKTLSWLKTSIEIRK